QTIGRWYWSVNPALERSWKGATVNQGLVFAPNVTVGYDVTHKLNLALEYYGSYGSIRISRHMTNSNTSSLAVSTWTSARCGNSTSASATVGHPQPIT
ncbi:MAG TPA: hypothetical protein VK807_06155, partial [Gemmatimonadaceae bacterium]|nr:hypothetical protein [Gemmatimonadaceae bacterium]